MSLAFHHASDVLGFAVSKRFAGIPTALVIASKVTGGAMRATGAMMCIAADGDIAGYISNGCVDADIIIHAQAAISDDAPRFLRYGEGSPFRDITLPCGGQIDLWVRPDIESGVLIEARAALLRREAAAFVVSPEGQRLTYKPKLRLRIAGRGQAVSALAAQALGAGFEVILQSPDPALEAAGLDIPFDHLTDPASPPPCSDDAWTAVVVMFHDHDWEPYILKQALDGEAFYIGAMGSRRTQALRKETLRAGGVPEIKIDRIHGPIGLIPSMRDANLLALSTLAQIVNEAQKCGRL